MKILLAISLGLWVFLLIFPCKAACPLADLSRDCHVDLMDFTVLASQWLTEDPSKQAQDFALLASQWLSGNRLPSDMIVIPEGTFQMGNGKDPDEGNTNELPVHEGSVDLFAMGKCEITNGQYCEFLNAMYPTQLKLVNGTIYASGDSSNSYPYCDTPISSSFSQIVFSNDAFRVRTKNGRDMSQDPVVRVSWYGAAAYCNWRSAQENREICYDLSTWACGFGKNGYRLATEAEWEYATRGGHSDFRFPWGDTIDFNHANYNSSGTSSYDSNPTHGYHPTWDDDTYPYTSPVGSFPANGYGLWDTAGNVWEWCQDWFSNDFYSSSSTENPTGPVTGSTRVVRGGSWSNYESYCRVSERNSYGPKNRYGNVGFRVVLKP